MEVHRVSKTGANKIEKKESIPTESISFTEVMGKKREEVLLCKNDENDAGHRRSRENSVNLTNR